MENIESRIRPVTIDRGQKTKAISSLFKFRIVFLLLIAAMSGSVLGAGGWPGALNLLLLITTGGLSAAGASALNQYFERDLDAKMTRTRDRGLPSKIIKRPVWVLVVGSCMVLIAIILSALYNPILAISNSLGVIIYIGVYTLLLKPRTVLNIVIGGAAGSMAVISGGAVSGAWNEPGVIVLSLLIFVWTPTHFWSLALAYRDDYARVGFPMLPVKITKRKAGYWIALHTITTSLIALVLSFHPSLGSLFFLPVAIMSIHFLRLTLLLLRKPNGRRAYKLFKFSNKYLGMVLLTSIVLPIIW